MPSTGGSAIAMPVTCRVELLLVLAPDKVVSIRCVYCSGVDGNASCVSVAFLPGACVVGALVRLLWFLRGPSALVRHKGAHRQRCINEPFPNPCGGCCYMGRLATWSLSSVAPARKMGLHTMLA